MTWTTVYDNPIGAEIVNYDWKVDHEYSIYSIAKFQNWELDNSRVIISAADLTPGQRGLCVRTIDAWMLFVQGVGNKKIHSVSRRGAGCPIVKILERPVVFGVTDINTNENWQEFWTGTAASNKIDFLYENDYEYLVYARESRNIGPYGGNNVWIYPVSLFLTEQVSQYNNGHRPGGEFHHGVIGDGYVQFWNAPNNPSSVAGRKINVQYTSAVVFKVYRRPIRVIDAPDSQYCGWRRTYSALPNGMYANGLPFNWPDLKELALVHSDPLGINEVATAFIYTDVLLDPKYRDMQHKDQIIAQESGSTAPIGFTGPRWSNKGFKCIHSWGKNNVRALAVYEKLETIPRVDPAPDPDPIPPGTSCEDICYVEGTVWEQEAIVEARIVSPPDWEQREYEFEWGGDIDGSTLRVVETQAGGRIARLKLNRTLTLADHLSTVDFNIRVTAWDKQYQNLGLTDMDDAILTFELPCVIAANDPDISIEDISILEGDVDHAVQVRVTLSEPYIGREPLCVDYVTRDGTATSDLSVRALARDENGLPFITVIESEYSSVRVYIDGSFPRWYNSHYASAVTDPSLDNVHYKILLYSRNLVYWLSGDRTKNKFLLLGDRETPEYNVKLGLGQLVDGLLDYWVRVASDLSKQLDVLYVSEVESNADLDTFLDQYDCIIYFSSLDVCTPVLSTRLVESMIRMNRTGLGIAVITDHGDMQGQCGFFRGANDFLQPAFGIVVKGNVDRIVDLFIEDFKPHHLWSDISGKFPSYYSESYVDAVDNEPDYVSTRGTLCFNSGEVEKVISVTIIGDTEVESDETFTVELSGNTGGVLAKPVGSITILNDDNAAPCGLETPSGGLGVTETQHGLGNVAGRVEAFYDMYGIPDMMEIFYNNQLIATTGGMVSNSGSLTFYYPGPPAPSTCLVRMTGSGTGTAWNYRMDCPTPLNQIQALMYATTGETEAKKLVYTPPAPQEIFENWNRFSNNAYFPGGVGATGDAAAWEFLTNPDRISQPLNTATFTGFVSPVNYSNYTFEVTLSGTGNDDDTVGLIIGYVFDGTASRMLAISRTRGGNPLSGQSATSVNFGFSGYGVSVNGLPAFLVGTQGGWNNDRTKVTIRRTGNMIEARCTPFYAPGSPVPPYDDNSVIAINLEDYPALAPFLNESPYGYLSMSQAGSTYLDITFTGALINNKIYDAQALRTWDYDRSLNQWYDTNTIPQVDLGQPVLVLNPDTGVNFLVTNTIQVL